MNKAGIATVSILRACAVAGGLAAGVTEAGVYDIAASGPWNSAGTWTLTSGLGGVYPVASDSVSIASTTTAKGVTLAQDEAIGSISANTGSGVIISIQSGSTTSHALTFSGGITKTGSGALNLGTISTPLDLSSLASIALSQGSMTIGNSQSFGTAGATFLTLSGAGDLRIATASNSGIGTTVTMAGDIAMGSSSSSGSIRLVNIATTGTQAANLSLAGRFTGTLGASQTIGLNIAGGFQGSTAYDEFTLNGDSSSLTVNGSGSTLGAFVFGGGAQGSAGQFKNGILNLGHSNALSTAILKVGTTATLANGAFANSNRLRVMLTSPVTVNNTINLDGTSLAITGSGSMIEEYVLGGTNAASTIATFGGGITLSENVILRSTHSGAILRFGGIITQNTAVQAGDKAVTVEGSGTVDLRNANSYAGGTTVAAGATLLVNNAAGSATGTGNVVVNGTLGGAGYMDPGAGNTVSIAGTLAPGNSIGNLTIGSSASLNNVSLTGTYSAEVASDGSSDQLIVYGDLSLGAASLLNIVDPLLLDSSKVYTIAAYSGTLSGTFQGDNLPGDWSVQYGSGSNSTITLSIPEPSTMGLAVIGVAGGLAWRRRKA